jgi:hypothetical protein
VGSAHVPGRVGLVQNDRKDLPSLLILISYNY